MLLQNIKTCKIYPKHLIVSIYTCYIYWWNDNQNIEINYKVDDIKKRLEEHVLCFC